MSRLYGDTCPRCGAESCWSLIPVNAGRFKGTHRTKAVWSDGTPGCGGCIGARDRARVSGRLKPVLQEHSGAFAETAPRADGRAWPCPSCDGGGWQCFNAEAREESEVRCHDCFGSGCMGDGRKPLFDWADPFLASAPFGP